VKRGGQRGVPNQLEKFEKEEGKKVGERKITGQRAFRARPTKGGWVRYASLRVLQDGAD